ncbi:MAG: hypothetical protein V4472_25225 [Pseudomonadota bacterium]
MAGLDSAFGPTLAQAKQALADGYLWWGWYLPGPGAGGSLGPWKLAIPAAAPGSYDLSYVEVTVTNEDGTQVLCVATATDIVLTAADSPRQFLAADLSVVNQSTGADLAIQTDGTIKSTAGGVFSAQFLVAIAGAL